MKIIDLLNKIANNEEVPKKIKYIGKFGQQYIFDYNGKEYIEPKENCMCCGYSLYIYLDSEMLNDEIEVIE